MSEKADEFYRRTGAARSVELRPVRSVLTLGCWDLLHVGHLNLLKRAAALGTLTVGVNDDTFVATYKQPCVQTCDERMAALRCLPWVHSATPNYDAGRTLILDLRPRLLVIGSDWHENGYLTQIGCTQQELDEWGVGVVYLPRTPGVSSSDLRARLAS